MKRLYSLGALLEPGFRMPLVAVFSHGTGVFNTAELGAQSRCPPFSEHQQPNDNQYQKHGDSHDYDDFLCANCC